MEIKKKYVIIVAGGQGLRMGSEIPKQFKVIGNYPILMHTLNTFYQYDNSIHIILVLPHSHQEYWNQLCKDYNFHIKHTVVSGGNTRFASVYNGLNIISEPGLIAVHDGVRPFTSQQVIANAFKKAELFGAVIPVIDVIDSLREIMPDKSSKSVPRQKFRAVQTPQVFRSDILKRAYTQTYNEWFTDDASVVESAGYSVHLISGNTENIKITTPQDLLLAEMFISHA